MGIRIHKILGYGLTDVQADTDKWEITDTRFNKEGYLFDTEENKFSIKGFKRYLLKRILILKDNNDPFDDGYGLRLLLSNLEAEQTDPYHLKKFRDFNDSVKYDMEFGEPSVLVVVPPSCTREWSRYDDAIDYYDPQNNAAEGGISEPNVIHIDRPLWPWDSYVNLKTSPPSRLNYTQQHMYYTYRTLGDNTEDPMVTAEALGLDTVEEISTYIAPIIPQEAIELVKYLKIFADDKYIYDLRPVIYGYWG